MRLNRKILVWNHFTIQCYLPTVHSQLKIKLYFKIKKSEYISTNISNFYIFYFHQSIKYKYKFVFDTNQHCSQWKLKKHIYLQKNYCLMYVSSYKLNVHVSTSESWLSTMTSLCSWMNVMAEAIVQQTASKIITGENKTMPHCQQKYITTEITTSRKEFVEI